MKKCIDDKEVFNSNAKKAWRKAVSIMFIHFGEGLKTEMKESEEQDKLNSQLKRKSNLF